MLNPSIKVWNMLSTGTESKTEFRILLLSRCRLLAVVYQTCFLLIALIINLTVLFLVWICHFKSVHTFLCCMDLDHCGRPYDNLLIISNVSIILFSLLPESIINVLPQFYFYLKVVIFFLMIYIVFWKFK